MQLQKNPSLSLWSYKACISFYFASRRWPYLKLCGHTFKKTVSFHDIVHFIDVESIVIYVDFDVAITFYPETPAKIRHIKGERNYISWSFEKRKCIPSDDQHNCSIDEQRTSNIFLNPYSLWDMVPTAPMSLNPTNGRDSMSNQCPQPTTHKPRIDSCSVFSSLRTMDSERKRLRVSFAFLQRKNLRDGQLNERVATTEQLSVIWMDGPNTWQLAKLQKKYTQNLTRCKIFSRIAQPSNSTGYTLAMF